MKNLFTLVFLGVLCMCVTSCKEKKESRDIITKIAPKQKTSSEPKKMSTSPIPPKVIDWAGAKYTIDIKRESTAELPIVEDANGQKYYDNKVTLRITRADGSVFFERAFTRESFKDYTNFSYARKWGLTGFNFDTIEGNNLLFAIAIGSPDEMADDEFIPITLHIDRNGSTSVTTQNQGDETDSDTKPKSELEISEEEGV